MNRVLRSGCDGAIAGKFLNSLADPFSDNTARENTDSVNVTFAGTDPGVTITAPLDSSTVNKTVTLTIQASVSDADGDSIIVCEYQIDGGGWNPMTLLGGGNYEVTGVVISGYSDGAHDITVRATDDSGDQGSESVTVTFSSTGEAVMYYLSLLESLSSEPRFHIAAIGADLLSRQLVRVQ